MRRFYCPSLNASSKTVSIEDPDEIFHLHKVLRLKSGDKIEAFNGEGESGEFEIIAVNKKSVDCLLLSIKNYPVKSPKVILACAVPKKSKFEIIVEKSTELGVDEIIPLISDRTEISFKKDKIYEKLQRFKTIALNASKQSHRNTIPRIKEPLNFPYALSYFKSLKSSILVPSLIEPRKNIIKALNELSSPKAVSILIGPEGDFTENEYALAFKEGGIGVSLGESILKVETAAISALSCINIYFENPQKSL
ncbi:MAG: 16S rRNA (uracil(1498)-N(3))-methyltransferase [Candidatus Omnitrophica bacterium]|nr:16S rRNA (uracil(1498)-N(3))-methyltransferase [Candidatus Omnitrophota bacterium]